VEEGLALFGSAGKVAGGAVFIDLRNVAAHRFPASEATHNFSQKNSDEGMVHHTNQHE